MEGAQLPVLTCCSCAAGDHTLQSSYQSGYQALQAAKKAPNPSLMERFCIFIREQEHTQKTSAASSGDANVDLVSYVEFQRWGLRAVGVGLGVQRRVWA